MPLPFLGGDALFALAYPRDKSSVSIPWALEAPGPRLQKLLSKINDVALQICFPKVLILLSRFSLQKIFVSGDCYFPKVVIFHDLYIPKVMVFMSRKVMILTSEKRVLLQGKSAKIYVNLPCSKTRPK